MNEPGTASAAAVEVLTGAELYQVVFVRDYVQLGLNPATPAHDYLILTVLSKIWVRMADGRQVNGLEDPASLTERIGVVVGSPRIADGEMIELPLSDATTVSVSLRERDLVGPEAATLRLGDRLWVWRPGDIDER